MTFIVSSFWENRPLWTPTLLTAPPTLWYNDDSAITDVSGAASQWNDLGSAGVNISQGTAANRPTINYTGLNSRRVLEFDGTNDRIGTSGVGGVGALMQNKSSAWAMVVAKKSALDGGAADRGLVSFPIAGSDSSRFFVCLSSASGSTNVPQIRVRRLDADAVAALSDSATTDTNWHIWLVTMDWSAGDGYIYKDGAQTSSNLSLTTSGSTSNTVGNNNNFHVGANPGGASGFLQGSIAEIIIGNSTLPTATEIEKLFGYTAHRWGQQSLLDVSHPYRYAPPLA